MSDDPQPKGDEFEDDFVPEDDAVIGQVFRRSLVVFALIAVVAIVGYLVWNRPEVEAAETTIEAAAPIEVVRTIDPPNVPFVDITREAGIDWSHFNGATGEKLLPETMGGGVAFFDYDNDGDSDLLLVNSSAWSHDPKPSPRPTMALYANDGNGSFTDVTRAAGLDLSFYGMGAAIADYDADGDADIFFSAVGPNRLLRNDGGHFIDVTANNDIAGGDQEWSAGAGFFDYDLDGDLDLFVCNYVRWSREIDFEIDFRLDGVGRAFGPPSSYEGTFPYLYRNDGDGFTEVSESAGLHVINVATGVPVAKSLAIGTIDLDGDRYPEIFVANDAVRNFLFHNKGDGTFVESGGEFGVAYDDNGQATAAMGTDFGYFRNDADFAFMIGNFANEMSSVYVRQEGFDTFLEAAIAEGIGAPSRRKLTFGLLLLDYDLDGRLDLLQANGHVENAIASIEPSQSYKQSGQLFWNAGPEAQRTYVEVPAETTGDLAREIVGRGAAYADIDGDGDLDVVLTQIAGPPLLLRNDQDLGHHWLRLALQAKAPNLDAIGTWVEIEAGGVIQKRQVMPTRSYLSQVEPVLTFGLGTATAVESAWVTWPDGTRESIENLEIDRLHTIEQSSR